MACVVVADDEPHVRRRLISLLSSVWQDHGHGGLEVVGEAEDGEQAVEMIQRFQPDIAFLDIRMPELSGLEAARRLADQPTPCGTLLVFVTAFDDHAIEAFEASAVDYLLKPVARQRLTQTVQRLSEHLSSGNTNRTPAAESTAADPIGDLLKRIDELQSARSAPPTLKWLRASRGDEVELVAVDDVIYFQAGQKYVAAVTAEKEHLLRISLKELVGQLDREKFWQIHRAIIVNVSQIKSARRDLRGRYVLQLHDRKETLRSSLAYADLFRSM
ncbi:MAG: LytTR family DNA-binding domain-containing protein [Pseudomonadota bacterium]